MVFGSKCVDLDTTSNHTLSPTTPYDMEIHYFNKELWCPGIVLVARRLHLGVLVLEILQEIEWQIGDFCEDGNAQVTENSN